MKEEQIKRRRPKASEPDKRFMPKSDMKTEDRLRAGQMDGRMIK